MTSASITCRRDPLCGFQQVKMDDPTTWPLKEWKVEDLKSRIDQIQKSPDYKKYYQDYDDLQTTAPHYGDEFTCARKTQGATTSIIFTAVIILALGLFIFYCCASAHGMSIPQYFMHLVHDYTHLAIGCGIPLLLVTGAAIVMYRARTKREDLLKSGECEAPKRGPILDMEEHLETVRVKCQAWGHNQSADCYIDTSTLDQNKTGKAYMYHVKDLGNHYTVSTIVPLFATPFYLIGTMVYNLIRSVIVPCYVLVRWLREKCTGEQLYPKERSFELLDVPKEFGRSIWRVVKAPFYAVAFIFAGVYSLFNPMGGRKLGSAIERDWNEGVSLAEGYWSLIGGQKLWIWEGGGGPLGLGRNGFYLAGCWQPTGVVEFKEGKIISAYWLPQAVDPKRNDCPYQLQTRTELEASVEKDKETIKPLTTEYNAILAELERRKNKDKWMARYSPRELPQDFKDFPNFPIKETNRQKIGDLTGKIQLARDYHLGLPPVYKEHGVTRIVVIALMVVVIAVSLMALQGTLTSFPQNFMRFVQGINWNAVGVGAGVFTVLTIGAAFIIYRVTRHIDGLTSASIGKLSGDDHWVSASYLRDDIPNNYFPGYIDISPLNEEGTGAAYMYAYKDEQNHNSVSMMVTLATPAHMIAAVVYNIIRFALIPFFILGCLLVEKASGTSIDPTDRPYRWSDIPIEMGKSLWRIVKAPFYALAFIFAALYSFYDPMNGRKLGSYIERDWNEGVTRAEGFWSVRGPQPLWEFEGGRNPSGLGKNGFYVAGCWQPIAVVHYDKWQIVDGMSLSRVIKPDKGKFYTILTSDILIQQYNTLIEQLERLA